ncbi:MAG TPA: hypothetical protein VHC92_10630 [Rhodanobacteraceae bacterium]|nr:hypothetical protein [Rhodanobacteraceae bacterium]
MNALCTSFGLRPRRIARSWRAKATAFIVALALVLAGFPAAAMPSVAHGHPAASAHSPHCAGHSGMPAHDATHAHDAAHACCANACACAHASALTPVAYAWMRVASVGHAFRFSAAGERGSTTPPPLRPPIR